MAIKALTIDDYTRIARSTAIYPGRFTYPALGLAGEAGELVDKIFPAKEDTNLIVMEEDIVKEIGDCLWYTVNIALDLSIGIDYLLETMTGGLSPKTFSAAAFQRLRRVDDRSSFLKLMVHVGRIAEVAKKALRDSGGAVDVEKVSLVRAALVETFVAIFEICEKYKIDPDQVAFVNAQKLLSRQSRGKLGGSGDNR